MLRRRLPEPDHEGDDEAQIALRFNLFQLLIAAPRQDERVNIGAKTLSGFGYSGHSFWDTETSGQDYSHGGDGLERGGLVFFRSMHEYQRLASERNWNDPTGKSFGTSWCVKPIEVEALIQVAGSQPSTTAVGAAFPSRQ